MNMHESRFERQPLACGNVIGLSVSGTWRAARRQLLGRLWDTYREADRL